MVLPNFLCVGAQKAGTTSLYHILRQHPEIYLPDRKELRFFDQHANYNKGKEWYSRFFQPPEERIKAVGEVTPSYMYYSEVPERIHQVLGASVKLIFILRHPVDRAFSHYTMNKRGGFESREFQEALRDESLDQEPTISEGGRWAYIKRGRYAEQIQRYLKYFDRNNMRFLIFERIFRDQDQHELRKVIDLLDIASFEFDIKVVSNPTRLPSNSMIKKIYHRDSLVRRWRKYILPSKTLRKHLTKLLAKKPAQPDAEFKKQLLEQYFMEDIKKLEQLTDQDFSLWYERST